MLAEVRPSVQGVLTPERLDRMLEPMVALCARLSLQLGRQGEVAVPEPRRREHTVRVNGDRAELRRAARRRGAERARMAGRPEQMAADQVAATAAAARAGRMLLHRQAEVLEAGRAEMPAIFRSLPNSRQGEGGG